MFNMPPAFRAKAATSPSFELAYVLFHRSRETHLKILHTDKGAPYNRPAAKQVNTERTNDGKRAVPPLQTSLTSNYPSTSSNDARSSWENCITNPFGLPLDGPTTNTIEGMDEWLECFWPGYIGSLLKPSFQQEARVRREDTKLGSQEGDAWEVAASGGESSPSPPSDEGESRSSIPSPSLIPVGAPSYHDLSLGYPTL